jgi:hypothetical protein
MCSWSFAENYYFGLPMKQKPLYTQIYKFLREKGNNGVNARSGAYSPEMKANLDRPEQRTDGLAII